MNLVRRIQNMVHLVYCDNAGKKGEKVLDKI
ncbi:hypothetical protein QCU_2882, partial [Clostridioides difficile CD68]